MYHFNLPYFRVEYYWDETKELPFHYRKTPKELNRRIPFRPYKDLDTAEDVFSVFFTDLSFDMLESELTSDSRIVIWKNINRVENDGFLGFSIRDATINLPSVETINVWAKSRAALEEKAMEEALSGW